MHFVNTVKNSIVYHGAFERSDCKVIIRHRIHGVIRYTLVLTSWFCPNTHRALGPVMCEVRGRICGGYFKLDVLVISQSHCDPRFNLISAYVRQ